MSEESTLQTDTKYPPVTLEVAKYDPSSVQGQMIWGLSLVLIVCVCVVSPFISSPMTDALTPEPASTAASLMLSAERIIFATAPFGYHLVSGAFLFWCCAAAALLVLEITGRTGNKAGACQAIWAAMLTAVLPINRALCLELSGQQWLLSNALAITAIFSLFRYRLLREPRYYWICLTGFGFCLVFNCYAALALPVALSLSFIVPPSVEARARRVENPRFIVSRLAPFWILAPILLFAQHHWQTPRSAYEAINWIQTGLVNLRLLLFPHDQLTIGTTTIIALLGLVRIERWRPITFLSAWAAVEAITQQSPTQFFAAAQIACIWLALIALPSDGLKRNTALILTAMGTLSLLVLFFHWAATAH